MPPWYRVMAVQARFDYSNETFNSILSYFLSLQVIEFMVDTAKGIGGNKKPTATMTKTGLTKKLDTAK